MENQAAPENTLEALEYPAILELLSQRTRTAYGRDAAAALRPSADPEDVRDQQAATREMLLLRETAGSLPLSLSGDARPLLLRLETEGVLLSGQEIHLLVEQMKAGQEAATLLSRSDLPTLRRTGRRFPDLGNLIRFLDGKISAAGELEDRCSESLLQLRRQVSALTARLEMALRSIAAKPEVARVLQDDFVALRNNRHVLPVRIDGQGCVEGIVHALSSSGATVYVEPLSTVSLNNNLVQLKEQEEMELRRILLDFTQLLQSRLSDLSLMVGLLAEVDLLSAKATLAEETHGVDPELTDGSTDAAAPALSLSGARHPLLERSLRKAGRPLVPLDLLMEGRHRVLVVSGPNTGGKTVALKTVGLLALMAQSGLKVPAEAARLPIFRRVLIDIGDHQSIPESLSTFSARLANVSAMARELEIPALVLLDEVGAGTDPEEGACLGAAIIEFFRAREAHVLATTHHQGIKAYAANTAGVVNASVEFDEESLRPLYRLRAGVPGRSGGLDIAERLGLPLEIVRQARSFLPRQREMLEEYLRSLQNLQAELTRRIEEMERRADEARRREMERGEAARRLSLDREARFSQYLDETAARLRQEWESYLREITDHQEQVRVRREFERKEETLLREARAGLAPDLAPSAAAVRARPPASLKPGARVRISSLRVEGSLERVEGERALVRSGVRRLSVPLSDLEESEPPSGSGRSLPPGVSLTRPAETAVRQELNLIGKRVEEALATLDKYLDDASLAALTPVRIIHGVGTGKLRAAVRRFLETHPHVEGFSQAEEREGGGGATVVRIRA